jgi:hypothetical protein
MNDSGAQLEGYATARRILIDAVRALSQFPLDSIVLVGAQAVYLRAPEDVVPVSPYTFDGDLVVDPRVVRRPRFILDSLEKAQFALRGSEGGLLLRNVRVRKRKDGGASRYSRARSVCERMGACGL